MTLPYNASSSSMKEYLVNGLERSVFDENIREYWYYSSEDVSKKISDSDAAYLIKTIRKVLIHDYEKIGKLINYLKNIATLFNTLELPIMWNLPSGLQITQSYMLTTTSVIRPFAYSKIGLNIKVTDKKKFDSNKQVRSLMPNLIHSLDASSLSLLYNKFISMYTDKPQFFSIHDCFATTSEKVRLMKVFLATVYTELYLDTQYLVEFDKTIMDTLKRHGITVDNTNSQRIVKLEGRKPYLLHDIQ